MIIKWDGKMWFVDIVMKIVWMEGYDFLKVVWDVNGICLLVNCVVVVYL